MKVVFRVQLALASLLSLAGALTWAWGRRGVGMLVLVAGLLCLSALVVHRDLREFRGRLWRRQGRCAGCGYDLRHRPERCPECGRKVVAEECAIRN